ncbi:MAG: FMN-binding protein [Prevotella sp.]|nr:FMN-binding protein [Prevotella sp.]
MKTTILRLSLLLAFALPLMSAGKADDSVMTKSGSVYVVNTTTLGKKVSGYVGATPLKVYIEKNKITRVELLSNQETPKYNAMIKRKMLPLYEGKTVKEIKKSNVDGVTGATFTSNAVKENVRLAVEYYNKNK